mgnify:CR=1 FL=1
MRQITSKTNFLEIILSDSLKLKKMHFLCFHNCCNSKLNLEYRWHLPLDFLMTHHPQTEKGSFLLGCVINKSILQGSMSVELLCTYKNLSHEVLFLALDTFLYLIYWEKDVCRQNSTKKEVKKYVRGKKTSILGRKRPAPCYIFVLVTRKI